MLVLKGYVPQPAMAPGGTAGSTDSLSLVTAFLTLVSVIIAAYAAVKAAEAIGLSQEANRLALWSQRREWALRRISSLEAVADSFERLVVAAAAAASPSGEPRFFWAKRALAARLASLNEAEMPACRQSCRESATPDDVRGAIDPVKDEISRAFNAERQAFANDG